MSSLVETRVNLVLSGIRKCSLCDSPDHNIRSCRNASILAFEDEIIKIRDDILLFANFMNETFDTREFNIWLSVQDIKMVKSFAIRKCGGIQRDNVQELVDKITYHLWGRIQEDPNYYGFEDEETQYPVDELDLSSIRENKNRNIQIQVSSSSQSDTKHECAICYEEINPCKFVTYNCAHVFCADCVMESFRTIDKMSCAMCRECITRINVQDEETGDDLTLLLKHGI